jgi:hypothetical protein
MYKKCSEYFNKPMAEILALDDESRRNTLAYLVREHTTEQNLDRIAPHWSLILTMAIATQSTVSSSTMMKNT